MMPRRYRELFLSIPAGLIALIFLAIPYALAQDALEIPGSSGDFARDLVIPRSFYAWGPNDSSASRLAGIHLFRMTTALPTEPIGLDSDNDPTMGQAFADTIAAQESNSASRYALAMGSDNPFFDFRHNSDPGGVGYYRLYSQYMFLDEPAYGASLGLQAWTPAGLEAYGIADGPTVVRPSFSWLYELGSGTALHGFISKDFRPRPGWTDGMAARSTHFGLALQSPCPGLDGAPLSGVHLFVEALGAHRSDNDGTFQLLPGVNWQIRDNCWLAGGFIIPVSSNRPDGSRLWQLTCSWQF